jgi:hypothetical protein
MKKILFSITAAMVMSATTVVAQNVNSEISTNDFGACKAYLDAHPLDTIRNEVERRLEFVAESDTTVARNEGMTTIVMQKGDKLFFAGVDVWQENNVILRGNHYTVVRVNPLPAMAVADSAQVRRVDSLAAATQALLKIASNYGKYPMITYWYESDQHKLTDGKIVEAAHRPLGWSAFVEGGYRFSSDNSDLNAFTAMAGLRYTTRVFNAKKLQAIAEGSVGIVKLLYAPNAEEANEPYWTPRMKFTAGLGLPLDALRSSAIYAFGGIGLDYEKTITAQNDNGLLQSRNLNLYPTAGIMLVLEPDRYPAGVTIKAAWEMNKIVVQNQPTINSNCFVVTAGFQIGMLRHWVKTFLK